MEFVSTALFFLTAQRTVSQDDVNLVESNEKLVGDLDSHLAVRKSPTK